MKKNNVRNWVRANPELADEAYNHYVARVIDYYKSVTPWWMDDSIPADTNDPETIRFIKSLTATGGGVLKQLSRRTELILLRSKKIFIIEVGGCGWEGAEAFLHSEESDIYFDNGFLLSARISAILHILGVNNSISYKDSLSKEIDEDKYSKDEFKFMISLNEKLSFLYSKSQIENPIVLWFGTGDCADLPTGISPMNVKLSEAADAYGEVKELWFIPDFYFELCRSRKISEWDPESCKFWQPILNRNEYTGRIRYIVRLRNGQEKTGSMVVSANIIEKLEGADTLTFPLQ
nr:hypothetical protein [uncultured Cohaesibacter sp.]